MDASAQLERAQSEQEECERYSQNVEVDEVVRVQHYEHVDGAGEHAQRGKEHQEVEAGEEHE